MKKRRAFRMRPGPLIIFLVYVLVAGIVGILINNRYYETERREHNDLPIQH